MNNYAGRIFPVGKIVAVLTSVVMGFVFAATTPAHADEESAVMVKDVTDGPLTFTVVTAKLNPLYPKDETLTPQGQFLILTFGAVNNSNRPVTYVASYQTLVDPKGRTFVPDTMAALREKNSPPIATINPGNRFSTSLVFDVPTGTSLSDYSVWLRASLDSAGAGLRLPAGEISKPLTQAQIDDYARSQGWPAPSDIGIGYPTVPGR